MKLSAGGEILTENVTGSPYKAASIARAGMTMLICPTPSTLKIFEGVRDSGSGSRCFDRKSR
jgi:hypothetical protein